MQTTNTTQMNLFYGDPDLTSITSEIVAIRPHYFGTAVAFAENIARAAGGGEPRDFGTVAGYVINDVEKEAGKTWIAFAGPPNAFCIGDSLLVALDGQHRGRRRRLHTALHLLIRSTLEEIGPTEVISADIAGDASAAHVVFASTQSLSSNVIAAIDRRMRSEVLRDRPIVSHNVKSIEAARVAHGPLFRLSDRYALSGKVRLVVIKDLDVNPCSGLHHDTSNIGPYTLHRPDLSDPSLPGQTSLEIRLRNTWMYWYSD